MKKIRIHWTPFALHCLDEIYYYITEQERSETPALKLINRILQRAEQLEKHPESGATEELLRAIG